MTTALSTLNAASVSQASPAALVASASYLARLGVWATIPFVLMLLAIALMPMLAPHFWERNVNRGLVALLLGVPVLALCTQADPSQLSHTLYEYFAFISLITSIYVVTGGIYIDVASQGRPTSNTLWLAVGAVLASVIGTTGASMLLLRPFLAGLAHRRHQAHAVVFFIFVVSNSGGLLTPLGDPPLFLGFLRGVPFFWPAKLWGVWLMVNGALVTSFFVLDGLLLRREPQAIPLAESGTNKAPPRLLVHGKMNLFLLAGLVCWIALSGSMALPKGAAELGLLGLAALSWRTTDAGVHRQAGFDWAPMQEVAILFAGIFATMPPALGLLASHGEALGLREPWQYFWLTGMLSSVLDNAPTYLTFTAAASAVMHTDASKLNELIDAGLGERLLRAISCGAVLMGAVTYVGNGPNLMVRAVANQAGIAMPSFAGYTLIAAGVLMPVFALVSYVFIMG